MTTSNSTSLRQFKPGEQYIPADFNRYEQYGVVTFKEDLVESDGTTQLYLVMAGLTST